MQSRRVNFLQCLAFLVSVLLPLGAMALVGEESIRPSNHEIRIGIFHGTFDPPHLEHQAIAEKALEQGLDYVFFVTNDQTFYKPNVTPLVERVEMCKDLYRNHPRIVAPNLEPNGELSLHRLMQRTRSRLGNVKFVGIIGADNVIADHPEGLFYQEADREIDEWLISRGRETEEQKAKIPGSMLKGKPAKSFWAADGGVSSTGIRVSLKKGIFPSEIASSLRPRIYLKNLFGFREAVIARQSACRQVFSN